MLHRRHQPFALQLAAAALTATVLLGCGGRTETHAPPSSAPPADSPPAVSTTARPQSGAKSGDERQQASAGQTRVDALGRKWIGEIPYDVWFDDPLGTAADTRQAATVTPIPSGGAMTADPVTPTADPAGETANPAAAAGDSDWKAIIPGQIVDAEVVRIRNRFAQRLQSVGSYNSSSLELPPYIASLAAMGGIATQHPDDIRWKDNAKYLRDLAGKMGEQKLERGAAGYRGVLQPWEQIVDILNGSPPPGLPESADETEFYMVADFGNLMKRLEVASNWLKVNVTSADALKEKSEDAIHEAYVLAALGKVITTEGYGYSDDDDFLGHANPMIEAGQKMAAAAQSGDYAAFDEAISRVYRSCTECHTDYR